MSSALLWEVMTLQKEKKRRKERSKGSRGGDRKGNYRIRKEKTDRRR